MTQVVLGEQKTGVEVAFAAEFREGVAQQVPLKQLLAHPERERHREGAESSRRQGYISFQQPLEFEEWLVVEHDVVEIVDVHAAFGEAVCDGVPWKARV